MEHDPFPAVARSAFFRRFCLAGWGGVGMLPFLELAHMVVVTCLVSFFCLIHSTSYYSHGIIPASFISDFYNAGCHSWPMPETRVAVLLRCISMDIEMCI